MLGGGGLYIPAINIEGTNRSRLWKCDISKKGKSTELSGCAYKEGYWKFPIPF